MDSLITLISTCQKKKIVLFLKQKMKQKNAYETYLRMANGWKIKDMGK